VRARLDADLQIVAAAEEVLRVVRELDLRPVAPAAHLAPTREAPGHERRLPTGIARRDPWRAFIERLVGLLEPETGEAPFHEGVLRQYTGVHDVRRRIVSVLHVQAARRVERGRNVRDPVEVVVVSV